MKEKDVNRWTIFETVVGSQAYGMATPESDVDTRGIAIPDDLSYYFGMGLNKFHQKDSWESGDDKVIYDLRKAFTLMADNNPNMLELLFVDEKFWLYVDPLWENVLQHRDKFLSKRVRYAYGGYAYAQLKRIQRHRAYLLSPPKKKPEREDFKLPPKRLVSKDQKGAFQWLLARTLENSIETMNFSEETKRELHGVNYIGAVQSSDFPDDAAQEIKDATGAADSFIESVMREKRYEQAMKQWNAYHSWEKNRNEKRKVLEAKYGFDTKHASHLVRLQRTAKELMTTGKLLVYRPDREELLSIRNGAWSYEKVVECAEQTEKELTELYKSCSLPKEPNRKFLDNLCVETISKRLNSSRWRNLMRRWFMSKPTMSALRKREDTKART